ncbi:ER lumen protein retaining receptor [Artemisia annua]|uniref:ER lumen protein retaining receptor n=1 Tax=Artemisia annua TaxID=35608 RepID=A0A2U1MVT3_ARTAN|nr:ER lumen protein retaining receptor [Artemisia annua]
MKRPAQAIQSWLRRQPHKIKVFLALVSATAALVVIRMVVYDHDNLFIAAEGVHALGISFLVYKLATEKTCAGLSLKSQELTAIFLSARLYCSYVMEYDVHTLLDLATLTATVWVIYMMRLNLNSSYMHKKDNISVLYVIVEPFTAHYVFALGVARFLSCAHWILQVLDTRGRLLTALGYGMWPSLVLLSEIVQSFILADFSYYYVQSVVGGRLVLRLPSGVV